MGRTLKGERKYNSCWYNRLQVTLYLLAFLTFGVGDALSSLWMFEQQGIFREINPILRYLFLNYNVSTYLGIKIWFTIVILLMIFWVQINSKKPIYWTVNGCLISFIILGTLATALNIRAGRNEALFLSSGQVIFLYLILIFLLTSIGEEIDKRTYPKIKSFVGCLLNDLVIVLVFVTNMLKKKAKKQLLRRAGK